MEPGTWNPYITFWYSECLKKNKKNADMWHILLSSSHSSWKCPERHPFAPALWPSLVLPSSRAPSHRTHLSFLVWLFLGLPNPPQMPGGLRLCLSMRPYWMGFSKGHLLVYSSAICNVYLKVLLVKATTINRLLGRNPSFKQLKSYLCCNSTKQPATTGVLSQLILFKMALSPSVFLPNTARATSSLTLDELHCVYACVCMAWRMHLGICLKLKVRTGGGNTEEGSHYQILAALPVPWLHAVARRLQ